MTEAVTRNIYEALAAARANFTPVHRNTDGQVGTRRYRYADLQTVLEAVEPALKTEGLMLVQTVRHNAGFADEGHLKTELVMVAHPEQQLVSEVPLIDGSDPQKLGSAITYARRYAIVAMLGLTTEDDDDGAAATSRAGREGSASGSGVALSAAPAAPAFDATAHGWESEEQAQAAHRAVSERIRVLAESNPEGWQAALDWRQAHSWPVSATELTELEEVIRLAEGFAPSA